SEIELRFGWEPRVPSRSGEVVPDTAPNYIRRECDGVIERDADVAGTVLIMGPAQSGRTTLARRLERLAAERGQPVAYVDLVEAALERPGGPAAVRRAIARGVGRDDEMSTWEDLTATV